MELDFLHNYCLNKKGVTEGFPFGEDVLVMKVGSKMFALIRINEETLKINLKCDPFLAEALRKKYSAVTPGYYMNKRHWNTVEIDGSIPENEVLTMLDNSYDLVFKGLKKSEREFWGRAPGC